MNHCVRYAVYYAPRPGSELWRLGSTWIGRDAASGVPLTRQHVSAMDGLDLDRLTAAPRHYGFHGTLRAPFEPADANTERELLDAVEALSGRQPSFEMSLEVARLGDFVALRPTTGTDALQSLHQACIRDLNSLRRPIQMADLRRRRRRRLTPDQDVYLQRWGYPYVFEHFRFHVTLTGRIANFGSLARVRDALHGMFAPLLSAPVRLEGVAVFGQVTREAPFRMLDWYELRGRQEHTALPTTHAAAPSSR